MDLTGQMLMDMQLRLEKPEVIIRPKLGPIGIVDRVDIPMLIRAGELAAQEALPEIQRVLSWRSQILRKLSKFFSNIGA